MGEGGGRRKKAGGGGGSRRGAEAEEGVGRRREKAGGGGRRCGAEADPCRSFRAGAVWRIRPCRAHDPEVRDVREAGVRSCSGSVVINGRWPTTVDSGWISIEGVTLEWLPHGGKNVGSAYSYTR